MTSTAASSTTDRNRDITVTIKTPAGIGATFEVREHDRVDKTVRVAVEYFVGSNQLAAGNYGLAVIRDGIAVDMTDAARLEDYKVTEGDELHLVNRDPQVDG